MMTTSASSLTTPELFRVLILIPFGWTGLFHPHCWAGKGEFRFVHYVDSQSVYPDEPVICSLVWVNLSSHALSASSSASLGWRMRSISFRPNSVVECASGPDWPGRWR